MHYPCTVFQIASDTVVKYWLTATQLVVLSAWASRVVTAFSGLYSLRLLSQSLTPPEYAIFAVIMGLASWLAVTDLGIGYAAQNAVTKSLQANKSAAEEILISYLMLAVSTTAVLLILYVFRESIGSFLFGKLSVLTAEQAQDTFFRSALLLTIGSSAAISNKILYGMQKGYIANIFAAAASVFGVAILNLGISSADDKVTYAVTAVYGPIVVFNCFLAAYQVLRSKRTNPTIKSATFYDLARASRGFFAFNIFGVIALQLDYLIMSQKVTPIEIIQYYTLSKIFNLIAFINQAMLFAIWPTFTAKYSSGETFDIRTQLNKLVVVTSFITVVATAIVVMVKEYLEELLSPATSIALRTTVVLGFGAVVLIRCLTDPFAIFLQSIGHLQPLILCAVAQAVTGAAFQWYFAGFLSIEGILVGIFLSFALTSAWVLPAVARKKL